MENKNFFGLLGYPIKYSLSPVMHNAAFKALGINAEYKLFEKQPEELIDFFRELRNGSILGINITIPYKEEALRYLDEINPETELMGAVNTILVKGKKLIGYNTDGAGFITALRKKAGVDPKGKRVVIIGAGGASRAVSIQLIQAGADRIVLNDIIFDKAKQLASYIGKNISEAKVTASREEGLEKEIREADILINATPIGIKPDDPSPIDLKLLRSNLLVYDLIYNPPRTKLLIEAERIGAKTLNGMGMLLYQGALAFTIWTGKEAPIEVMARALKEKLKTQD